MSHRHVFSLTDAEPVLRRTPAVLQAMLSGLSEGWTRAKEGEPCWTPHDVVGHLIHCEREDWAPRARIILHEPERVFTPFDRFAQFEAGHRESLEERLQTFAALRDGNLEWLLENVADADLERHGTHPDLGPVTMRELLSTWVIHDLSHIRQIARSMASRYRDEAGPWAHPNYLSIVAEIDQRR